MRLPTLICVVLAAFAATAQTTKEIKKNKDIIWAGTIETDYSTIMNRWNSDDRAILESENGLGKGEYNAFKTLKIVADDPNTSYDDDQLLVTKMLNAAYNGTQLYQDSDLKVALTAQEAASIGKSMDTIVTFHPKTFEEIVQVVENSLNPDDVRYFRVKQYIYYDKKDVIFRSVPVAVAPIIERFDDNGNYLNRGPMFWMPVDAVVGIVDLKNDDYNWVKRIYRNVNLTKTTKVKGKSHEQGIDDMVTQFRASKGEIGVGSVFDPDGNTRLTKEEVMNIGSSVDTIITFDKETFEEIVQVVVNTLDPSDITTIRLMQDWAWDSKKNKLVIHSVGFAPIISRYDDNGNFLNSGPMLRRREDFIKR